MFFVVKPVDLTEWQNAMFILSYYHVDIASFSNGVDLLSTYMVIGAIHPGSARIEGQNIDPQEQLRLAETAFQMNWHQVGKLCPHCHCADESGVCGHLTFNRPIKPAF